MKTHVRIKLGWSKLVLVTAVLAVVAMLSVIGLCFTNANADDTADSANAEWSIPVTNLFFGQGGFPIFSNETEWLPKVTIPTPPQNPVEYNPYLIQDNVHELIDDKVNEIYRQSDMLVVTLVSTGSDTKPVYKSWAFRGYKPEFDWYLIENGASTKITEEHKHLVVANSYSIYYGKPDAFSVNSDTKDVGSIYGEYRTFSGESKRIENVPLPTTLDLTGQIQDGGVAYFMPYADQGYTLILQFKDAIGRESTYNIQFKPKTGKYEWLYNGKTVSTNAGNPTPITFSEYKADSFTIRKAPVPPPITDFSVKGQVVNTDGEPIANASVGFYNSDVDPDLDEPLIFTFSDENGNFVLEGCYTGTNPEVLKIAYTAKHYDLVEANFSYDEAKTREVDLDELELQDAVLDLYSDSPQHKSFTITTVYQEKGKDPELQFCRTVEYFGKAMEDNSNEENYVFGISDNGVLTNVDTDDDGTTTTTIAPNGQDGYIFDNYLVNDKTSYRVGDTVDVIQPIKDEGHAKVAVNYTVDTSKIAKTGDENYFVVVSLLAIVAAVGTLLVLRRRKQDF